jgi:hypothetical protein
MTATVTQLRTGMELVDSAELARLREIERLAALLTKEIYDRRARGWSKVPTRFVVPLAEALLKGRT